MANLFPDKPDEPRDPTQSKIPSTPASRGPEKNLAKLQGM